MKTFLAVASAFNLALPLVISVPGPSHPQDTLKAIIHTKAKSGLPSDSAAPMFSDPRGYVWVNFGSKGIGRFDREKWEFYDSTNGLMHNAITPRSGVFDSMHNVWVTYPEGGWSVFNGSTWKSHPLPAEAASARDFRYLFSQKNGNVWFLCDTNGIGYYNGNTWTHFSAKNGLAANKVSEAMLDESNNRVWVLYKYAGAGFYDGVSWTNFSKQEGLSNDTGYGLTINRKGHALIGHSSDDNNLIGSGYSYFNGQSWSIHKDWPIRMQFADENGDFWFTFRIYQGDSYIGKIHDGMLSRYRDSTSQSQRYAVSRFAPGANGTLWVVYEATNMGTAYYNGQTFRQFPGNKPIYSIDYDSKGYAWGTYFYDLAPGGGAINSICRFDGAAWKFYTTADGLYSNSIGQLIHDGNGNTFVSHGSSGKGSGVGFFNGTTWSLFTSANGLLSDDIRGFIRDSRGNVWVYQGMSSDLQGIGCFSGNRWINFSKASGNLPSNRFTGLFPLRNGETWGSLDSSMGLVQFTTDSIARIPVSSKGPVKADRHAGRLAFSDGGILSASGFGDSLATLSLFGLDGKQIFRTALTLRNGGTRYRFPEAFKHRSLILKFETRKRRLSQSIRIR